MRATEASLHGDPALSEELATSALEIGTASGQPDAFSFYGTQLVKVRQQQGRLGELVPLIRDLVEQNPGIPTYGAGLAFAHLDAGDTASARRLVEEAAAGGFALPMDTAWLDGMILYAHPTIELEIRPAAALLLELLAPFHRQVPHQGLMCHEPVAMFLGGFCSVLDRFDDSNAYFEEAHELSCRGDMRYAQAHTELQWGRMLSRRDRRGDRERARELLERARVLSVANGYSLIESRAADLLATLV
jgi:tetratricopeptide (TPR) repeat protein